MGSWIERRPLFRGRRPLTRRKVSVGPSTVQEWTWTESTSTKQVLPVVRLDSVMLEDVVTKINRLRLDRL